MSKRRKYLSGLSDEELIEMYKELYDSIYNVECYSSKDIVLFCEIERELIERSYKIRTEPEIVKS
ncbi:MAG: hypothetical protein DRP00_05325 [Candidatus Aenigmatarchaeota archaeon]|nr:MAG: hypothetical protein DRP00_05325 [Candidatus Aenigmarchaeota archaeon]